MIAWIGFHYYQSITKQTEDRFTPTHMVFAQVHSNTHGFHKLAANPQERKPSSVYPWQLAKHRYLVRKQNELGNKNAHGMDGFVAR